MFCFSLNNSDYKRFRPLLHGNRKDETSVTCCTALGRTNTLPFCVSCLFRDLFGLKVGGVLRGVRVPQGGVCQGGRHGLEHRNPVRWRVCRCAEGMVPLLLVGSPSRFPKRIGMMLIYSLLPIRCHGKFMQDFFQLFFVPFQAWRHGRWPFPRM